MPGDLQWRRGREMGADRLDPLRSLWIRFAASTGWISSASATNSLGVADVAPQFNRGVPAWATVLQRLGVVAIGPDLPALVEQAPAHGRHRERSLSDARDRRRLVLLFPQVHRRGLPTRAAGSVQPQASCR